MSKVAFFSFFVVEHNGLIYQYFKLYSCLQGSVPQATDCNSITIN